MPAITVQVESGLGLPYAPGAEQSLSFTLLAAWNACWGALGGDGAWTVIIDVEK